MQSHVTVFPTIPHLLFVGRLLYEAVFPIRKQVGRQPNVVVDKDVTVLFLKVSKSGELRANDELLFFARDDPNCTGETRLLTRKSVCCSRV